MIDVIDHLQNREPLTEINYETVKLHKWWIFGKEDAYIECVGMTNSSHPSGFMGLCWELGEELIELYEWPTYMEFINILEDGFSRKANLLEADMKNGLFRKSRV